MGENMRDKIELPFKHKITFNHKIIDADDLAKILMEWNYYPAIFAAAIDACPALDLFEEEKK
ncbi:MAG: hypothetical protein IIZ93_06735 [Acidaminococcaceae bacterium]|nr:hypothetical protein [Acidaminococcaceae bacterium]